MDRLIEVEEQLRQAVARFTIVRTQLRSREQADAPGKDEVAAHLVNLAWNGLSHLEHDPLLRIER